MQSKLKLASFKLKAIRNDYNAEESTFASQMVVSRGTTRFLHLEKVRSIFLVWWKSLTYFFKKIQTKKRGILISRETFRHGLRTTNF